MLRSIAIVLPLCAALVLVACGGQQDDVGRGPRTALITPDSRAFAYEQPQAAGECDADEGCHVNGCGNHCTSAGTPIFAATCEVAIAPQARCGCVSSVCVWYTRGTVADPFAE